MRPLAQLEQNVPGEVSAETSHSQPIDQLTPEPIDQRRADALERIVEAYLASNEYQHTGGERYMVNIHTDKVN